MSITFTPLLARHQDLLWRFLHIALWDPPPAGLRPLETLQLPGVRIYAEEWGCATDVGVIAQPAGQTEAVGACWMRLVPDGMGLAYVDEQTPQLGIALLPAYQHQGYGRQMMLAALDTARHHGFRQVSLTVHPQNPAIRVYESCGFVKTAIRNNYHLMLVQL
ncbi:GNAT family N-acetyltransferase [Undibacterium sp. Ji49W]|uniref:GNAT family N-acetyltransferase n=1 Tax=Undibacterium sp. Ji49W TaxID=3413040 RepID=UPI003BF42E21